MPGGARAIGTVAEPRADSVGADPAPRDAPRRVRGSWNQPSNLGRVPTALVTGANRGLEVARQLAGRGFDVLAGARDPAAVPSGLHAVRLDVTDQGTIGALRHEVG